MSFHSGLANWQLEVINRYVLTISTYCKSKSCGNPRAWWHMWHDRNSSGLEKNSTEKIQVRPANEVTTSVRPIIITIRDCYPNNRLLSHNHPISTPTKFESSISNPKNGDRKIIFHGYSSWPFWGSSWIHRVNEKRPKISSWPPPPLGGIAPGGMVHMWWWIKIVSGDDDDADDYYYDDGGDFDDDCTYVYLYIYILSSSSSSSS